MKNILIAIAIIVGLFVLNTFNNNKMMAEFSFTDIDGQAHTSANYQDKPLLVIFWATDCPGCVQEMPELVKLYESYSTDDFSMLGIAMAHDSIEHIEAMRENKQLPYTLTWDQNNSLAQAFSNVRVTPTHFLIAPNGEIIMRKIGSLNTELIHNKLRDMGLNKT
mgnify:FL=1